MRMFGPVTFLSGDTPICTAPDMIFRCNAIDQSSQPASYNLILNAAIKSKGQITISPDTSIEKCGNTIFIVPFSRQL